MSASTQPLLLFILILLGAALGFGLSWLKARAAAPVFRAAQALLALFWLGLGLALILGGVRHLAAGRWLPALGDLALGLGLPLSGLGRAHEVRALAGVGIIVLAISPLAFGALAWLGGEPLLGALLIALGVGTIASGPGGRVGTLAQPILGSLIAASGLFSLAGWIPSTEPSPWLSALMLPMGMITLGLGIRTLLEPPKNSQPAT